MFYNPNVIEFDNNTEVPIVSTKEIYKLASKVHNPPHIYGLALKTDESEIFTDFLPYIWEEGGCIFDEKNLCRYKTALFDTPWNATWGVAIPSNQPDTLQHQTLSKLMQLLNKESNKQVSLIAGSPVRISNYCANEIAKYPWLSAQKQMLKRAKILPKNPKLGLFLENLYEMAYKAFIKELSSKEALQTAQKEAMKYY